MRNSNLDLTFLVINILAIFGVRNKILNRYGFYLIGFDFRIKRRNG